MLQTFIPVFVMTFFICLFIVLMQFLWRYIDDLVGKGLDISVIAELFFYAALTMVPMALPLAILLASLMTFGNLGEKFELTAMKAAGISLVKVMRPLIILMILISAGAFFFQNNVLPVAQTKMWTLLFSMRQTSPEMEIPEKAFYTDIDGYVIYVDEKDKETGLMRDVMIHQITDGYDQAKIIVADSGRLSFTPDRLNIKLRLWDGELYGNMFAQSTGMTSRSAMPNEREKFTQKEFLIPFDANFNRMDESTMRNQYIGKNISELSATVDSLNQIIDSIGAIYGDQLMRSEHFGMPYTTTKMVDGKRVVEGYVPVKLDKPLNLDSLFTLNPVVSQVRIDEQAIANARRVRQEYEFRSYAMDDDLKSIRRHGIEMHKKFTLSFAVIIFFFIGAPLGAIIKKGGLGMPLIISVILFIIYYIIDNTGYKLARDGRWDVPEGMWLSSFVLLPLGVFLTYKAVHDSSVLNVDAYKAFFNRLIGRRPKRSLEVKKFVMDEAYPHEAIAQLENLRDALVQANSAVNKFVVKLAGRRLSVGNPAQSELNNLVDYQSNSLNPKIIQLLNQFPFVVKYSDIQPMIENIDMLLQLWGKEVNNNDNGTENQA